MNRKSEFTAPWGMALKTVTAMTVLILLGIPLISILSGPRDSTVNLPAMTVIPLSLLIGTAFFAIRGYVLTSETLLIRRLGWNSKVNLAHLSSAEADPKAMTRSIRVCGNGGLFCFAGSFWNKKLKWYRAFATDPKRSVVLRFPGRTVVVTPDDPERLVAKIKELTGA